MSSHNSETRIRILNTTWKLLEATPGKIPSMSAIAKASSLSRQALYLHFASRTELFIATTRYVDEVKGLDQRLQQLAVAATGEQKLQRFIELWGAYIPEVYAVAKALMIGKEVDDDAAAAWREIMGCLREVCVEIIARLEQENRLAQHWFAAAAADFLWTLTSISNWESLTRDCGWSTEQYIESLQQIAEKALLTQP